MDSFVKKGNLRRDLLVYILKHNDDIKTEYNISIPETLMGMSSSTFDAWLYVHASKIFLAKNVKKCPALKGMLKEYLLLDMEIQQYTSASSISL